MVNVGDDELIGVTAFGGQYSGGIIFRITPSTDAFAELYSFNILNGGTLIGGLLVGSDGQLYGTGSSGGTNFQGTVYRFDPSTHLMTTLHSFADATDGYGPRSAVIEAGTAVGIRESSGGDGLTIGPNPTNGDVTIQTTDLLSAHNSA